MCERHYSIASCLASCLRYYDADIQYVASSSLRSSHIKSSACLLCNARRVEGDDKSQETMRCAFSALIIALSSSYFKLFFLNTFDKSFLFGFNWILDVHACMTSLLYTEWRAIFLIYFACLWQYTVFHQFQYPANLTINAITV